MTKVYLGIDWDTKQLKAFWKTETSQSKRIKTFNPENTPLQTPNTRIKRTSGREDLNLFKPTLYRFAD